MEILNKHKKLLEILLKNEGVIYFHKLLKDYFFTKENGRAFIFQNIDRYGIIYLKKEIFNDESKKRKALSDFWELVAFIKYLKDNLYIFPISNTPPQEKLSVIYHDFDQAEITSSKIKLSKNGFYTTHPEIIYDNKDEIVFKGVIYKDSSYKSLIEILMGGYIVYDRLNLLLKESSSKKKKSTFLKYMYLIGIFKFGVIFGGLGTHFFKGQYFNDPIKQTKNNPYLANKENNHKLNEYLKNGSKIDSTFTKPKTEVHYGIDISRYNGDIVEKINLHDSIAFVVCKATQGKHYVDPYFHTNWASLKKKNIIRGVYHFYKTDDNPIEQAKHFIRSVKNFTPKDMPPIVDVEKLSLSESDSTDISKINKDLLLFLDKIEKAFSKRPVIYSNYSFANTYLKDTLFAKYPLWIADYSSRKMPKIPKIWKEKGYKIWQRTDKYSFRSSVHDLDIYQGTLDELLQ